MEAMTRENADLRARLSAAEKARDEQAEAVRVLACGIADVPELLTEAIANNPIAAAAVEEAGNG